METMNTDTPETDGEWNRLAYQDHPKFERNLADFARKLERERDEAQRRLRKSQVENDNNWQAMELYEAERVLTDKLADIADGTSCRECGGEDQARLACEALDAWKEARK